MGFIDFVFAFFVFLLVCGVIWLYSRLNGPRQESSEPGSDKEKRLYALYQNLEDAMNGIEEYVEEARTAIARDREQLEALLNNMQKPVSATPPPAEEPTPAKTTGTFRDQVGALADQGLDAEQIARKLGVSRGEVTLALGMPPSGSLR